MEGRMKEEALKLANQLDGLNSCEPVIIKACETMIRRLVEELNKKPKPLTNEEIEEIYKDFTMYNTPYWFARAIEERHGIK